MLTDADIQKMADLIAERFQPEKIILFGSYANGTATEDSDVDLVVVTRDERRHVWDQGVEMMMVIRHFPVATDLLVRTKKQLEKESLAYWSVFNEALENGRVLYDYAKSA